MSTEDRNCRNCKQSFVIEPDDFAFYEKVQVPPPTFCPECRMQRRLIWRNDFTFYNRKCDLCNRNIISVYSPDNPQTIYCNKCWWSDKWDSNQYGTEFDFTKPFFEQFRALREKVPTLALVNDNGIGSINSEYTQNVEFSKNCYMVMVAWKLENCLYSSYGVETKDAVDCMGMLGNNENVYELMYSEKCYGCRNIYNSTSLIDCAYCYDCHNCEHCFMSAGLRNKKYYFKNTQYSEEEYKKLIESYTLHSWSGSERARIEFENFILKYPRKFAYLKNCVNCTGDNQFNAKNAHSVFHARRTENSKYLENGDTQIDSYDLSVGGELEQCYEGITPDHSHRALFTVYTWKSTDVTYCEFCQSSSNLFGCVGLKSAEYSILNKIYSKEQYFKLRNKIVEYMRKTGEWGNFFPMTMSPFSYNETMAQLSFPLTKEETLDKSLKWQDNIQQTTGKETLDWSSVPDSIKDIQDSLLEEILRCQKCRRNFRIVPAELEFYRKNNISIPRLCFYCRLTKRFQLRTPAKLWHRQCMCDGSASSPQVTTSYKYKNTIKHPHHLEGRCPNEFETSYAPERKEIVYCEQCYNAEVI